MDTLRFVTEIRKNVEEIHVDVPKLRGVSKMRFVDSPSPGVLVALEKVHSTFIKLLVNSHFTINGALSHGIPEVGTPLVGI